MDSYSERFKHVCACLKERGLSPEEEERLISLYSLLHSYNITEIRRLLFAAIALFLIFAAGVQVALLIAMDASLSIFTGFLGFCIAVVMMVSGVQLLRYRLLQYWIHQGQSWARRFESDAALKANFETLRSIEPRIGLFVRASIKMATQKTNGE